MSFLMTEKERTGECNREKGAKICRNWSGVAFVAGAVYGARSFSCPRI